MVLNQQPELRVLQQAPPEDLHLVRLVLRKDRKATARLVEEHSAAVLAYVGRRLAPRTDLVEDLVQEVFLAAWRQLDQYRGDASLRGWLLGIARHKVEDHYRQRLRACEPLPGDDEAPLAEACVTPGWDDELDAERRRRRMEEVMASLPESYAIVLQWRYWEKRSAREMADSSGKTEKAIERLLARAREQFKRRWNDASAAV